MRTERWIYEVSVMFCVERVWKSMLLFDDHFQMCYSTSAKLSMWLSAHIQHRTMVCLIFSSFCLKQGEYQTVHILYYSGEHHWECNLLGNYFSARVQQTSFSLVLTSQALVHTPVYTIRVQLQRQLIAHVEIAAFFQWWVWLCATGCMSTPP